MAPLLSAAWGPGATGVTGALGSGQLVLVGTLTALTVFLLVSLLLMLCASCQGQKKKSVPTGDHENLMNGVSERETFSQSVESPATDMVASSSQNGPLTCGTVLSEDTLDTSPQLSEEMLSSQSELRSSKCPQDRELPSIPPNSALEEEAAAAEEADPQSSAGEGTYEVVKETASRDVSVEDSLPATPDRAPLQASVEYASVDLNKKSRYSADLEGRRAADLSPAPEPEEEQPPPIPDKVLDENDNQQTLLLPAAGLQNGEINSPLSPMSGQEDDQLSENELSGMYSSVAKPAATEKEHDYSSIGEINGLLADQQPDADAPPQPEEGAGELLDPAYETIGILKSGGEGSGLGPEAPAEREADYANVGEVELTREISRL
ncbi:hypothetical protein SKAU_G00399140 [Synaphobranchus kaupii]|uniref:Phosphoprotein membrane anchor with glycosphingolipid microdomains 1 n=1 Tax=Synaphobranchus kaupii TaxID=118154 RepID=A0A9Q1IBE0_SYNKA|nr:hypothetical protein SKAU_G00399140 [Synaphobranchus kaupii]